MRLGNHFPGRLLTGFPLWLLFFTIMMAAAVPATLAREEDPIRHALKVELQPGRGYLKVEDKITLPESLLQRSGRKIQFSLHGGLRPRSLTKGVKILHDDDKKTSGTGRPEKIGGVAVEYYNVILPAGENVFTIRTKGRINNPVDPKRGTTGLISKDGVFLAGSTLWIPWFNENPIAFTLEVDFPRGWEVLSQGERTLREEKAVRIRSRWESPEPQEEVYLIGGRLTEYSDSTGKIPVMAFLRMPDKELAGRYLKAGRSYLEMYEDLLGPYPYRKFAMVENFWETGYGMPSFTLLGPSVIRLPFILHSSYPHEILHNWWGNGVYVHYERGNWSEGLTAYMADHLIQEQRGKAAEYRRRTLQKYADYISENNDFPLTGFRMRRSPSTEAVGYGKTMMFFHMLRTRLGDEAFVKALRNFYRDHKFHRADFDDLRGAFTDVSGQDLKNEFDQWIRRAGAPVLNLVQAVVSRNKKGYRLAVILEQTQPGPGYHLRVPLAVQLKGKAEAYQVTVELLEKRGEFMIQLPVPPIRLVVDPEFDIFRRLDRRELPPALSQAFGTEKTLMLIPAKANRQTRRLYRRFAESWAHDHYGSIEIKLDNAIETFPSDRAVWILGWENHFLRAFEKSVKVYNVEINSLNLRIGPDNIPREDHTTVLVSRHPDNPESTLAWLTIGNPGDLERLLRKLPHYGRYSYAAFKSHGMGNILKGRWMVSDSPLSIRLEGSDDLDPVKPEMKLAPRTALIEAPE